jgi:hypothetical protein
MIEEMVVKGHDNDPWVLIRDDLYGGNIPIDDKYNIVGYLSVDSKAKLELSIRT